ncbi:MAG: ATP-binding cassette domain-containing protein, partial [Bacteroidaceae bacterium]|nr:ATP-binding cassette domain-containing protein [Bacteroidaceae bacterium]
MIQLRGITKSFGSLQVLRGIDLDIARGEIVSIVGPSGAGKTTLLQIMGTLDRPDSGQTLIDGQDVSRLGEKRLALFRNQHIGFVFQFHQLLPEFTALENVMIPAFIGGAGRREAEQRATELLAFMGLQERATHKPNELSGGEKQRVAVARALMNNPSVVMADEPSGSLDSQNKEELHRLFFDLRDRFGQTFVIVTHDETLAGMTDRTIHMMDGKLMLNSYFTIHNYSSRLFSSHRGGREGASNMNELQLGRMNSLPVAKQVDFGYYLEGTIRGRRTEVLLPTSEVDEAQPQPIETGTLLEVFLYLDQEERLVATMHRPLAMVDEFAYLEVSWVNTFGAFLHWGPQKDLFVPFREQKMKMQKGHSYIVHLHIDPETYRIVASAKVERYLDTSMPPYREGDEVDILVWQKTDLGLKAIVEGRYGGLLYDDQLFRHVQTGDRLRAYVSQVRPDGKLDLALQPTGGRAVHDFATVLLDYLKSHGGQAPLGDKTPPEE